MVVTDRKDGRLRRTVDLQRLNAQCLRETHHCESPFKLAMQVPANTFKTVVDATDGYHLVELDQRVDPQRRSLHRGDDSGTYAYRKDTSPQGMQNKTV